MATTVEEFACQANKLRRKISSLKRQLRDCRESMENIIEDDCEEVNILSEREVALLKSIELVQVELAQKVHEIDTVCASPVIRSTRAKSEEGMFHSLEFPRSPERFDMSPTKPVGYPKFVDETALDQPDTRKCVSAAADVARAPVLVQSLPVAMNPKKLPEFPNLIDFSLLRAHYSRCEAILMECGFGSYSKSNDFSITQQCYSVIFRFISSLKVPSMFKHAEDLANYHDDWSMIKGKLLERFACPAVLHEEYQRRLSQLHLNGDVSALIDQAREAWRLGRVICKNACLEKKSLINRLCQLLPVEVLREVYKLVQAIENPEWQFDVELESFLGAIQSASKLFQLSDMVNGFKPKRTINHDATKKISVPKINFRDFFKSITVSFNLTTPAETLKSVERYLPKDRFRSYASPKSKGFLVGFTSKEEVDSVMSELEKFKCVIRDFRDKEQANPANHSTPPPAVPRDSVAHAAVVVPNNVVPEYYVCGDVILVDNPSFVCPLPKLLQVDTGAGEDYLCLSKTTRNALKRSGSVRDVDSFHVSQANGTLANVSECIETVVSLYPADSRMFPIASHPVRLYLLGIGDDSEPGVLLGRKSISKFDLVISKRGVCTSEGVALMETSLTETVQLFESAKFVEKESETMLSNLVSQDWSPMQKSPSYSIRLRELKVNELKDHPQQTHVFEVNVPKPSEKVDQSEKNIHDLECRVRESYRKMSPAKRNIHRELTVNYENLGWWTRASVEECRAKSSFTPAPCFLIGGGVQSTKKPRIVVDFRPMNSTIPDSSTPGFTPAHCLAALRMKHPEAIVIADASSAFYKIRIADDALWLISAQEGENGPEIVHILCSRVVFGVQFGPSSLISSMTLLFTRHGRSQVEGFSGWYVDDNLIGGSVEQVVTTLKKTVSLLRRVGHELQFQKCAAICVPEKKDKFSTLLSEIGHLTVSNCAVVFGTVIEYKTKTFSIKCDGIQRKQALTTLASAGGFKSLSKSDFFGIAGCLSYDALKSHAETKLLSDCLKSLIGREYSDQDWKVNLCADELSERKTEAFNILTEWASELLESNDSHCEHETSVVQSTVPVRAEICLYTDSSTIGAGFTICCPSASGTDELWTDSWRWSGAQLKWHCNLLEFATIEKAIKPLVDILAFHYTCTSETTLRPIVRVFSDNRSAVKWSSLTSGELLAKHQSRHSIMRMVDSISAEWQRVRQFADTSIAHVSGLKNARADILSRYMYRTLKNGDSTGNLSELLECEKKAKVPKIKEGPLLALIEAMESDDSDLAPPEALICPVTVQEDLIHSKCDPEFKWWYSSKKDEDADENFMKIALPLNLNVENDNVPIDTVKYLDSVCSLRNDPSVNEESLIETLAADCYDLDQLHFRLNFLIEVLRAWRGRKGVVGVEQAASFSHVLGRCSQVNLDESKLPIALKNEVGPCVDFEGLRLVRVPLPTGEYLALPLIPFQSRNVQAIIIRDAHRRAHHMGSDYTFAKIYDEFYLAKGKVRVNDIISKCLICQMRNATRKFKDGFTMGHNRINLLPYQSMAIDHLSLDNGLYCLSVVCLNSGHSSWSLCDRTADDTATALRRILYRYSVQPKYILADKAVNLSATIRLIEKEFGTVEFHQTTSYSQFENGVCERLHKIGCDILRTKLHLSKLTIDPSWTEIQIQDLLDLACCALNLRPVGWYVETSNEVKYPITPHVLVFGNCGLLVQQKNPVLDKWKEVFFNHYWQMLKRKSEMNVRGQKHVFRIGEPVLVFNGSAGKLEFAWKLAHVKDIVPDKNRVQLVDMSGKMLLQNVYNVCPLKSFHQLNPYDVTRKSAIIEYEVENEKYLGKVIDEIDGKVLISWYPRGKTVWPEEWLEWTDLIVSTGGRCEI